MYAKETNFCNIMPGIASATGLIEARIRPIHRPKPKHVKLTEFVKPAPFSLRPFSSLFNPYPYGCSILCNHPADCEAKEVLRRAKDSWASEGKALLLPEEMDMIKANLISVADSGPNPGPTEVINTDTAVIPEELFRKYTETDSRPLTPAPTLASGPILTNRPAQDELLVTCNPRERTTLVLDLRTGAKKQLDNETFSWHAMTLEPPPTPRKAEILIAKPILRYQSRSPVPSMNISATFPNTETYKEISGKSLEEDEPEGSTKDLVIIRRRGKRLRKGKFRRGSAYGQLNEVRDLFEPTETQISHIGDSRRTSIHTANGGSENQCSSPKKASTSTGVASTMPPSFIEPDILKHLCRELDRDKVEAEFSIKRRIALEEALRVKGENYSRSRTSQTFSNPAIANAPRVFSRQTARFEILDSESLRGLTVLEYLSKHVFVSSGRKLIFGRVFSKFHKDTMRSARYISPKDIQEAIQEVVGRAITEEQEAYLKSMIGEVEKPLNFRSWCGLCAAVERLLCPLPPKDVDPSTWMERTDFEVLERRLKSVNVDAQLSLFLREISNK